MARYRPDFAAQKQTRVSAAVAELMSIARIFSAVFFDSIAQPDSSTPAATMQNT
jgi:hypothetical protein